MFLLEYGYVTLRVKFIRVDYFRMDLFNIVGLVSDQFVKQILIRFKIVKVFGIVYQIIQLSGYFMIILAEVCLQESVSHIFRCLSQNDYQVSGQHYIKVSRIVQLAQSVRQSQNKNVAVIKMNGRKSQKVNRVAERIVQVVFLDQSSQINFILYKSWIQSCWKNKLQNKNLIRFFQFTTWGQFCGRLAFFQWILIKKCGGNYISLIIFSMKKSFASCLFFFTLILLTQSIIIDKAIYVSSAHTNTVNTNSKDDPKRLLQTVTVTTNTAVIIQKDLIMNINIKRSKAKVQQLTQNSTLTQIVNQWASTLRKFMPITKYLQLYGILDMSVYTFESMPTASIEEVIEQQCKDCYQAAFSQIVVNLAPINSSNQQVVVVLKGGYADAQKYYKKQQTDEIINRIKLTKKEKSNVIVTPSQTHQNQVVVPSQVLIADASQVEVASQSEQCNPIINNITTLNMKGCCPQGSWPQLAVQYKPKGTKSQVQGVSLYHVGSGQKALLIISDIFGASSGRHQVVADIFASLGYNVFLPDILYPPFTAQDFSAIVPYIKNQPFEVLEQRFLSTVKYMESQGIKEYFSIGFCWGVWFAYKMAAKYQGFRAIVGPHPSLMIESKFFNKSQNALAESIKCPSYLLPAGNDPDNLKSKGELVDILIKRFGADKAGTTEFPQMAHGWVVRGDLKKQEVARDFNKAINLTHEYFSKFV